MDAAPTPHGANPVAAAARQRWPRPVGAFILDTVIAATTLLVVGLLSVFAWGLFDAIINTPGAPRGPQPAAAPSMPGLLVQLWIGIGAMAAAAIVTYYWQGPAGAVERRGSLNAMRQRSSWFTAIGTGLAVFFLSAAIAWSGRLLGVEPAPTNLAYLEVLAGRPVMVLLVVGLLAPAYEELLFRRVLFGRLWRAGRPVLGLVLSSAVFAFVHEVPGVSDNTWPALAMLLLVYGGMGAAFAWVYWRTGTLWAPIAAHATNNLLAASVLLTGAA
ncbi:CPBP family intramembrane glutamic endopeptidase [Lysobacter sp. A3-1-A15]|uniref:CPBP family intramembrane glutamic endopeptidase n=1 Tax=Novilysobacter viscosus TaxID=3098602 RepID=UPI002ED95D37